jgi:hypothetical protein
MTKRRKWAAVPGLALIAVTATVLSAYSGAQQGAAGAAGPAAPAATAAQPVAAASRDTAALRAQRDTQPEGAPWGYSGASTDQGRAPEQPIAFPHPQHVQSLGMSCLYCHSSANKSPDPGMPSVGTCMGCHLIVAGQKPEIQKLQQYWNDSTPIPWVRIHKVPDYVQFPHMRHVNGGVSCQTCHGEVQKMPRVYQYSSLNMGWCVNCHVERKVRYDCATCHY